MRLGLGERLPAVGADEIGGVGGPGAAVRAGPGGAVAPDVLLHDRGRGGLVLILRAGPGQVGAAGEADEIVLLDPLAADGAGQGRHVVLHDGWSRESFRSPGGRRDRGRAEPLTAPYATG